MFHLEISRPKAFVWATVKDRVVSLLRHTYGNPIAMKGRQSFLLFENTLSCFSTCVLSDCFRHWTDISAIRSLRLNLQRQILAYLLPVNTSHTHVYAQPWTNMCACRAAPRKILEHVGFIELQRHMSSPKIRTSRSWQ